MFKSMTKVRRAITVLCMAVALTAAGLTSSAAQPATGTDSGTLATQPCNDARAIFNSGKRAAIPVFALFDNYTRDCLLRWGDGSGSNGTSGTGTSQAVWFLQGSLRLCNNSSLAVDGYYRDETRNVVAYIQGANGISVDGIYGPQTRKVMRWAFFDNVTGALSCRYIR